MSEPESLVSSFEFRVSKPTQAKQTTMETCKVESALNLGEKKATDGMANSLKRLLNLLKCPLCDKVRDSYLLDEDSRKMMPINPMIHITVVLVISRTDYVEFLWAFLLPILY